MKALIATSEGLENNLNGVLNEPVVEKVPPGRMMSMMDKISSKTSSSTLSADRAKAWLNKMEIMRAQQEDLIKRSDFNRDRLLENNKQLKQTLLEMESFKAEHNTHSEVLEVLKQGIEQFAQLKANWENMLLFFTDISNCVKISMGKPLQSFAKHASITMKNVTAGKEITRMDIDQIYGPCNNTVKVSFPFHFVLNLNSSKIKTGYLVNRLASVYMDISTKHIMPQVSEMSRYLAISQQETSAEKRINANAKVCKYVQYLTFLYKLLFFIRKWKRTSNPT